MARKPPRLEVLTTPNAAVDLAQIWAWNAQRYDLDHADKYVQFLQNQTDRLAIEYQNGRPVPGIPEYQYVVLRKGRGHGHIAVYWVRDSVVEILHYFHTAQDWQRKL